MQKHLEFNNDNHQWQNEKNYKRQKHLQFLEQAIRGMNRYNHHI